MNWTITVTGRYCTRRVIVRGKVIVRVVTVLRS